MQTKITYLLLAALLAGAAVSLMPTAAAQKSGNGAIQLNAPSDNVKPLQGPISFTGKFTGSVSNDAGSNIVGIPVTYSVSKQPAWAQVTVSPLNDVIPIGQTQASQGAASTFSLTFSVTVTATDQAPAFQPDSLEISATTTPATGGTAISGKGSVPITASYFSILDVQLSDPIKVERPQQPVSFPLKISNFGNANTKVSFQVQDNPQGLNAPPPIPVVLQSKQAGGSQISQEIPLTIQTPYKNGYMNQVATITYKVTSAYALDPKLVGDSALVGAVITTKGFYVPGPELPLMVGLIALGALVIRRRV